MQPPINDKIGKGRMTQRPKIGVVDEPHEKSKVAEYRRTLVEGAVLWPRRFGVPQGPLDEAFKVGSFGHQYIPDGAEDRPRVHLPRIPSEFSLVEEGPHTDDAYRVTYRVRWVAPRDWGGELARFEQATHNYVSVEIVADWPANEATGPGRKSVRPAGETGFTREGAPTKGPTFSVVHEAG